MQMDVRVEIAARRFAGTDVAVINVIFPTHPLSKAEIMSFDPEYLRVVEAEQEGSLKLIVDGDSVLITVGPENGDVEGFRAMMNATGIFALSMLTGTEQDLGVPGMFVGRTLMAENAQGRVISDSGAVQATPQELELIKTRDASEEFEGTVVSDPTELASFINASERCAQVRAADPSQSN